MIANRKNKPQTVSPYAAALYIGSPIPKKCHLETSTEATTAYRTNTKPIPTPPVASLYTQSLYNGSHMKTNTNQSNQLPNRAYWFYWFQSPVGAGSKTNTDGARLVAFFDVVGKPAPDPRARSAAGMVGVYKPDNANPWKDACRAALKGEIMADPPEGVLPLPAPAAFVVAVMFRFARPKSHLRTGRNAGKLKDGAPPFHTGKPDIDNLLKSTLDAMGTYPKGMPPLLWCDDAQVVGLIQASKRWADVGEEPGATVAIVKVGGLL